MLIIWQRETHTDKETWREGKFKKKKRLVSLMKANPCTKTWEADVLVFAPPSFRLNESESGLAAIPYLKCEFLPFMSRVEIFVGFLWWQLYQSYQSGVADWNAISICRDGKNEQVKQPLVPAIASVDITFHCCATLSLFNPSYIRLWTESFFGLTVFLIFKWVWVSRWDCS